MKKIGFDSQKYIELQSARIRERIDQFGGKLYLEFGGKLYDDNHASRVLPGFQPDSKLRMLLQLKEQVEMVIAINADDIEKNKDKKLADLGKRHNTFLSSHPDPEKRALRLERGDGPEADEAGSWLDQLLAWGERLLVGVLNLLLNLVKWLLSLL